MKTLLLLILCACQTFAAEIKAEAEARATSLNFAQVVYVSALQIEDDSWCFKTTVEHNDQGWEHYADGWEVLDLNGKKLGYRLLGHPHVNEQPFTRRLCEIIIPNDTNKVVVRAKCNKHGFGGKEVVVDLNNTKTELYSVKKYDVE